MRKMQQWATDGEKERENAYKNEGRKEGRWGKQALKYKGSFPTV